MYKKINEIAINETFETFVLIKEMSIRTSKTGKTYQQFKFRDKSGEIMGFLWDVNDFTKRVFVAGTVVFLCGKKELYQNIAQFNQLRLSLPKDGEPNQPEDFEKTPSLTSQQLKEKIAEYVGKIQTENWRVVVEELLNKYEEKFYSYPAAKSYHHDFSTGLAFHTFTMLEVAQNLLLIYPDLNASLLYSGIVLHDLGKVLELSGVSQTEYTTAGQLIGHIALVDEEITRVCQARKIEDTQEEMILLRHMVLSHHGQLEFGSPVLPKILEAEVLHLIDNLDATIAMITSSLAQVSPGEKTPRIQGLSGRNFYKPKGAFA